MKIITYKSGEKHIVPYSCSARTICGEEISMYFEFSEEKVISKAVCKKCRQILGLEPRRS